MFMLGGTGAIDIQRPTATGGEADLTVMLNTASGVAPYMSGFQEILLGSVTSRDRWARGSTAFDVTVRLSQMCLFNLTLYILVLVNARSSLTLPPPGSAPG